MRSLYVTLLVTLCIFRWTRISSAYQFLRNLQSPKGSRSIFERSYRVMEMEEVEETIPPRTSLMEIEIVEETIPPRTPLMEMEEEEEIIPPRTSSYQYGVLLGLRLSRISSIKRKKDNGTVVVEDVDHLRNVVLDQQKELRKVQIQNYVKEHSDAIQNHEVLKLLQQRYETFSTPGNRQDNATLALAMEGGGMRGCVSAGMAAAIASLGLTDAFDTIYGSSAGSVVGAYMISRQMCVDVYVDILPAAKKKFVCKRRLVRSIASSLADVMVAGIKRNKKNSEGSSTPASTTTATPGMNISYVLDGIMGEQHGLRPLDMKSFQENDEKQQLRIVASTVDGNGNMFSKVFGSRDFFNETTMQQQVNGDRQGLFACLQASMTVPGATGPPVKLQATDSDTVFPYFDAFCFEPIPYRSAVEEGATHVLALCTRPEGFLLKTKPGVYEQGVAPLYFRSNGLPEVAKFFEKGGQQFVYAEDLLTLEQGKLATSSKVLVPPPKIFHGADQTASLRQGIADRHENWKQGHLFPLKVPETTPELAPLEQDKDAVLKAVQGGFAAAFDILAPVVGLDLEMTGMEVSQLVFPKKKQQEESDVLAASGATSDDDDEEEELILNTKVHVPGFDIRTFEPTVSSKPTEIPAASQSKRKRLRKYLKYVVKKVRRDSPSSPRSNVESTRGRPTTTALGMKPLQDMPSSSELSHALLNSLPGLNGERASFHHLSKGLRNQIQSRETIF